MAGIPERNSIHSALYKPASAKEALGDILGNSYFEFIAVHYSDDGLVPLSFIKKELRARCRNIGVHKLSAWAYTSISRPRVSDQILLVGSR